ncbi:MAG: MurR/RpiR family transcriptional regulator [Sedimentibacter sp.]|uniref:MurR/RpiR family transcriptional regulator n=1 Tax=Sedimentibacter sp. TaxID=1960295 RepID=UPI0031589964
MNTNKLNKFDQLCNISDSFDSMPRTYKKIVTYLRTHDSEVYNLSITQLARKLNIDSANITRFCQQLGYSGYSDFRFSLKHNIASNLVNSTNIFQESDNISETLKKTKIIYQQMIGDVFDLLDPKIIEYAAQKIYKAKKVYVYTQDGNITAAQFAQFLFWQIGIPCYTFSDPNLALTSAAHISHEDVAIGIAFSGDAKLTVDAIEIAKSHHAAIIAITGFNTSKLAKISDVLLCYNSRIPDDIRCIPVAFICEVAIIGSLQASIINLHHDELTNYLGHSVSITQNNRY